MTIDKQYMTVIMHKALEDIKAKEFDYASNKVKIRIALGEEEIRVLLEALTESEVKPNDGTKITQRI